MEKSLSFFGKERENKKKWRKNIPDLEKLKIKQFQNENREKMIQKKKRKEIVKGMHMELVLSTRVGFIVFIQKNKLD
jgi:hypothetical protein